MKQFTIVKSVFLLLLFTSFSIQIFAQEKQKFTISGYVKDASNGEMSIGATVFIKELTKGGSTNQYGFYSITVEKGNYTLIASYVGYENFVKEIKLDKDIRLNIELSLTSVTATTVEVTSEKTDKNISSSNVAPTHFLKARLKAASDS